MQILSQPRLRLPPYAKRHAQAAATGWAPARYICVAGDWTLNKSWVFRRASWRALVPPENTPDEFDWRWCAAFEVIVVARSRSRVDAIATAINIFKPKRLVGLSIADAKITVYRKP